MRTAIIALGSRGDVEPYIALGKGLKKAGHYVRIVSHQNFESLVASHDLEFWAVAGNVQEIVQSSEMSNRLESGSFLSVISQMKKEAEVQAVEVTKTGKQACQGMDMILTGIGGLYIGASLAEAFKIPLIQAYYIPFNPNGAIPSFLFPNFPQWLGATSNRISYHIMRQIMWQGFRSADKLARKEILNLPNSSFWGPYRKLRSQKTPVLYGFSKCILPNSNWGQNTYATGFWFLEEPANWTAPKELERFVQEGTKPIYVGFGSMSNNNPQETANLVLSALKETKQRAIMLSGWGGLKKDDLPPSVYMVDSVPFSWLFPRVAAVVHHGGAGTTHHSLRAGVPSIIIPFFADQPFWANQIYKLGVGPKPIPRKMLTTKLLAKAIVKVMMDNNMHKTASELGNKIQEERGVDNAVGIITKVTAKGEHVL